MGTDIHLFIEQRRDNGKWFPLIECEFSLWRKYTLFSTLAGVREREGFPPISQPRGVPADVSEWVGDAMRHQDYHSHSWISDVEFREYFPRDDDSDFWCLGRWAILAAAEFYETRFVFAFDC